jgi:plastocyanin
MTGRRGVFSIVIAMTMTLGFGACGSGKSSTNSSSTTTTAAAAAAAGSVTVQTGVNDPTDKAIAVLQFMPASVTVAAGQSVKWSWDGTIEPHSVTFFPPGKTAPAPGSDPALFAPTPATGPYDGKTFVNSGLQPLGPAPAKPLELKFAAEGTYSYVCVIHPQMMGTVKVVAVGGKVDTAAEVKARGDSEKKQWLAEGQEALKKLKAAPPASTKDASGATTWRIEMGAGSPHTDILAFAPVPATVKAGDSVTFVNNSSAPHTGSFFNKQPPIENPLDPRVDAPAPGKSPQTLNDTDFFNTGLLPPNAPPGAGPPEAARSFTFKVPKAGSYNYICILHIPSGMAGLITAT